MTARGYRLRPAATEELDAAGEWYDAQLSRLGLELFDSVEEAIEQIRRFVMRRFPFSIVYYAVDDIVRIVAIAHAKRKPGYWRMRIRDAL